MSAQLAPVSDAEIKVVRSLNERAHESLSLLMSFRVFRSLNFFSIIEASALALSAAKLVAEAEEVNPDTEIHFPSLHASNVFNSLIALATLSALNFSSGDASADAAARALLHVALGELAVTRAASRALSPRQRYRLQGLAAESESREQASAEASAKAEADSKALIKASFQHIPLTPTVERLISDWVRNTHALRVAKTKDIQNRNDALNDMLATLSRILRCPSFGPGAIRLLSFGSTQSGFDSGGSSDVDCVLLVDGARLTNDDAWKKISRAWMFSPPRGWSSIEVISFARVPILRAIHERSLVQLDVSVGHENGLHNTALLRAYTLCNSHLAAVGVAVKAWAKERGCADASKGTLSSYGWVCLLIFFAQRCGLVPVLTASSTVAAFVKAGAPGGGGYENDRFVSGWRHSFVANGEWASRFADRLTPAADVLTFLESLTLPLSPGAFLISFFRFTRLLFAGVVPKDVESVDLLGGCVSIRTGGYLQRRACEIAVPLVNENGQLLGSVGAKSKKARSPRPKPTPSWRAVTIEDPFELDHDLARVLSLEGQQLIRQELNDAVAALEGTGGIGTSNGMESSSFYGLGCRISALTASSKLATPSLITPTSSTSLVTPLSLVSPPSFVTPPSLVPSPSLVIGKQEISKRIRSAEEAAKELAEKLGRTLTLSPSPRVDETGAAARPVDKVAGVDKVADVKMVDKDRKIMLLVQTVLKSLRSRLAMTESTQLTKIESDCRALLIENLPLKL